MGALSFTHLLLLLVIMLLFFGPSRLPSLGKSMGEAIRGFKKGLEGTEIDVTESSNREKLAGADSQHQSQQKVTDKDKV